MLKSYNQNFYFEPKANIRGGVLIRWGEVGLKKQTKLGSHKTKNRRNYEKQQKEVISLR